MVLTAKSASVLSVRPVAVPRLPVRSRTSRAVQPQASQQRSHTITKVPAEGLRQTATQLTGVAGLLVPLLLSDPAFAATPDGEHLTKVRVMHARLSPAGE